MKRSLTVLLMVLFIAGIVFAADAKPKTTTMKPKFKKKTEYNTKIELKFYLKKEGEDEVNISFIWDYDLVVTDVKSGFLEKAKINLKHLEYYRNGVYEFDQRGKTPEKGGEFSVEDNLLKNYLREVPDEQTPKVIYRLMIALSYVYLTKEKLEIGKNAEIPSSVTKGLQSALGFEYESDLKYKMRIKEEIERKKPVFGIEKGYVIETGISWRDGDDGLESRAIAVYDSKSKMISGVKAHGWVRETAVNNEDLSLKFELNLKMDPPGNFKNSDNPKPPEYPKIPENKGAGADADDNKGDKDDNLPTAFKVGEAAPDFTLEDLNGKKVSLSDFKGKVVLLHTWATTIEKIDEAMLKVYKGIYEKWSTDKLAIVSLGIGYKDDTKEKQKEYVEKNDIKWVTLWDKDRSITNKYQLKNQFYVALVSTEGKAVNWGYLGDKDKDAEMGKYLQENCSK